MYWERVYRERRGPASPDSDGKNFFTAVHDDERGLPDAFARYRILNHWPQGQPANELHVLELHASDPESEAALWSYLLDVDLVATIKADDRPADEALRWRLADPRRLQITEVTDHLWVRIVDLVALAARLLSDDLHCIEPRIRSSRRTRAGGRSTVQWTACRGRVPTRREARSRAKSAPEPAASILVKAGDDLEQAQPMI